MVAAAVAGGAIGDSLALAQVGDLQITVFGQYDGALIADLVAAEQTDFFLSTAAKAVQAVVGDLGTTGQAESGQLR